MLQVWIGGILLVLGMVALLANPVLGGILIAIGYMLYKGTDRATRAAAESTFWGFALLCGVIVGIAALISAF